MALIAVLVAFLAIVTSSGDSGGSSTTDSATSTSARTTTTSKKSTKKSTAKKQAKKEAAGKIYTVQVGDTLGGIADKTGVPLERIEELNPNVDPHTMNAGQEIRLK